MSKLILGCDPDLIASGISYYNKDTKELQYMTLKFFDLYKWLIENKENIIKVKCEAGWLNKKSNFRVSKSKSIGERIAKNVGENHATGKLIIEMLEDLKISYKLSKPLLKKWKGKDGKITHEEIVKLLKPLGIEMGKKSNQDQRDAILICLF